MFSPVIVVEISACLGERERDRPLGFHWRTIELERIQGLGVPHHTDNLMPPETRS